MSTSLSHTAANTTRPTKLPPRAGSSASGSSLRPIRSVAACAAPTATNRASREAQSHQIRRMHHCPPDWDRVRHACKRSHPQSPKPRAHGVGWQGPGFEDSRPSARLSSKLLLELHIMRSSRHLFVGSRSASSAKISGEEIDEICYHGPGHCGLGRSRRRRTRKHRSPARARPSPRRSMPNGARPRAPTTGIKLNYQAIGSGAGINQINNRTVDFGASDMPVTGGPAHRTQADAVPHRDRRRGHHRQPARARSRTS